MADGGGEGVRVKTFWTRQTRVMNCLHGVAQIITDVKNFMKPERSIHARKSPPLVHTFPLYNLNTCFIMKYNEYNIYKKTVDSRQGAVVQLVGWADSV
jgi:hypothetical protein